MNGAPVIDISNLYKSFANNHVLKDFNMRLGKGENVAILGKSGSGKSVLIKCIIGPLLFSTLLLGIAGHSDSGSVGRMGWKTILYFEIVTTIALVIGLCMINLFPVGKGLILPHSAEALPVALP